MIYYSFDKVEDSICFGIEDNGKKYLGSCKKDNFLKNIIQKFKGSFVKKKTKVIKELIESSKIYPVCNTILERITYEDNLYNYFYDVPQYEIENISINIERKRHELIEELKSKFLDLLKDKETNNIGDRFETWYWELLGSNYDLKDPVIPYFLENDKNHIQFLQSIYKIDEEESKKITNELSLFLQKQYNELISFYKNNKPRNNKNSYEIRKQIKNKKYNKLKNKFHNINGTLDNFDNILECLVYRHKYMKIWGSGMQFGLDPRILYELKKKNNYNFEFFSSAFNSTYSHYCSLFYDLERYFGSRGSFFRFTAQRGNYYGNPPFYEKLMNRVALKINSFISESKKHTINIIFIIPVWDIMGKKVLEKYCDSYRKFKANYANFPAVSLIKENNKYKHLIFCQNKIRYFDHFKLKKIDSVSATHLFLISNKKLIDENIEDIFRCNKIEDKICI